MNARTIHSLGRPALLRWPARTGAAALPARPPRPSLYSIHIHRNRERKIDSMRRIRHLLCRWYDAVRARTWCTAPRDWFRRAIKRLSPLYIPVTSSFTADVISDKTPTDDAMFIRRMLHLLFRHCRSIMHSLCTIYRGYTNVKPQRDRSRFWVVTRQVAF